MAILYNIYTGSQFKPANPFRLLFTKYIYFYLFFTNHGYKEYQKNVSDYKRKHGQPENRDTNRFRRMYG